MDIDLNGIRLHYLVDGDGPPVILLHGYQLDHTYWTPQVRALRDRYRVVVPDLRGHGSSDVGSVQASTMEMLADDIYALLDRLGVHEPVVFGGLSMGGYTAFAFFRKYRDRIRALVLADTRATADTDAARLARLQIAEQTEREQDTTAAIQALHKILFAPQNYGRPEFEEPVRRMAARLTPAGVAAAQRGMAARPDSSDLLPMIDVPTLILVGEHDSGTPVSDARYMHERIKGSELVVIPDAGHLSNLENPEAFNQALLDFLGRLP